MMKAHERLMRYAAYDTTSREDSGTCPSTPGQVVFADFLAAEMKELGFSDVRRDENGYLYGWLPQNCDGELPVIGLIAHMDTSEAAPGGGIKPRLVEAYAGGDIVLNEEKKIVLHPEDMKDLADPIGDTLVVTDGTTLLGADDKAGIAEILTAAEELKRRGTPHGRIAVAFTPDEEIGRGADRFDVPGFGAEFAYTVDGGKLCELEYENFNAASAVVAIKGLSIHPGTAKNRMRNAALFAAEFVSLLPPAETPEHTEGYEGFYHLTRISGDVEHAELRYIIRDHDRERFEARKDRFRKTAEYLNGKYGEGTFELRLTDSYYNMKEVLAPRMEIVERAQRAMRAAGVEPAAVPIRGGTDGSRLSYMGLPCPNLPTGGYNAHGRFEFASVREMDKVVEILIHIAERPAD